MSLTTPCLDEQTALSDVVGPSSSLEALQKLVSMFFWQREKPWFSKI